MLQGTDILTLAEARPRAPRQLADAAGELLLFLGFTDMQRNDQSDDAVSLIHTTCRGAPRAVNNLALQSLLAAYADDKTIVDESSTRTAVTEVTTE